MKNTTDEYYLYKLIDLFSQNNAAVFGEIENLSKYNLDYSIKIFDILNEFKNDYLKLTISNKLHEILNKKQKHLNTVISTNKNENIKNEDLRFTKKSVRKNVIYFLNDLVKLKTNETLLTGANVPNVPIDTIDTMELYEDIYPSIALTKDKKLICISTPNSVNELHKFYKKDNQKENQMNNEKFDYEPAKACTKCTKCANCDKAQSSPEANKAKMTILTKESLEYMRMIIIMPGIQKDELKLSANKSTRELFIEVTERKSLNEYDTFGVINAEKITQTVKIAEHYDISTLKSSVENGIITITINMDSDKIIQFEQTKSEGAK